jgi:alpha-1,3-rhamnosyl/mannosyltransferase
MANETPVVTSNVSSLPEVAGGAAVLVDPYDVESIADGMRRAVTDEALRRNLIALGRARARDFSWHRAAAATHAVYRDVLGRAG